MKTIFALTILLLAQVSFAMADSPRFSQLLPVPAIPTTYIDNQISIVVDRMDADRAAAAELRRAIYGQVAADRAAGNLQTRTPSAGQLTGALGVSGDETGANGLSVGARYGLSDRTDIWTVIGVSESRHISWGAGVSFILN